MDVMSLRRMVMAQMASGARFIAGTVSIPAGSTSNVTINFGQSFDRYLIYVEMDAASKTALMNSGQTSERLYAILYKFATPVIGNYPNSEFKMAYKIKPSDASYSATATSVDVLKNISSTSIDLWVRSLGNSYGFYPGYTYNYYIVEIK